jgi:hypothetical protein
VIYDRAFNFNSKSLTKRYFSIYKKKQTKKLCLMNLIFFDKKNNHVLMLNFLRYLIYFVIYQMHNYIFIAAEEWQLLDDHRVLNLEIDYSQSILKGKVSIC